MPPLDKKGLSPWVMGWLGTAALQNLHPRADAQGRLGQGFQVNRCIPGMERWHSQGLAEPVETWAARKMQLPTITTNGLEL